MLSLCLKLRDQYNLCAVTNDIFTREDGEFLIKNNALTSFAPLLEYAKTQGDLYKNFITRAINRNVLEAEKEGE